MRLKRFRRARGSTSQMYSIQIASSEIQYMSASQMYSIQIASRQIQYMHSYKNTMFYEAMLVG